MNALFIKETWKKVDSAAFNIRIIIHVFIILSSKSDIRMISEGSCDWGNDAKNKALKSQSITF